ncbi:hypothetical protein AUC70_11665 [Methyloceanibacter stevinii]|uniref:Phage tail protein n=1 Tax=Methyloceanibacter stevinii TaxID=1774970 RepID=A0A1E3VKM1_9HYPH|nr:hypothetical protein [Methyloceanibacter stevinii]ODR93516.1 hypothetical protein AUC70_11665 [Methyloceanibacter stevinii]
MAFTYRLYNHTPKLLANQEVDLDGLYVMLLAATAPAFDAAHTTLDEAAGVDAAHEVHGNGWTEGGELITGAAVTVDTTDDAKFAGDEISKIAVGGNIGPASAFVVYYDAGGGVLVPFLHCDFGGAQEAGESTAFKVRWHINGILRFNYSPPA